MRAANHSQTLPLAPRPRRPRRARCLSCLLERTVYYAPPATTCRSCWRRACADRRRAKEIDLAAARSRRERDLARRREERHALEILGKLPGQLAIPGVAA